MKKGQTFTTDFMGSIVILGFILMLFMSLWSLGVNSIDEIDRETLIENQADRTAVLLTQTTGYPEDWNEVEETRIIGLTDEQGVLQEEKIQAFEEKTYEEQLDHLRTTEFHLTIQTDNQNWEIGETPSEDARLIIPKRNQALLEETDGNLEQASMRYTVWN